MEHDPLDAWDYPLPEDRIARHPLPQRDGGRLLCLPRDGRPLADRRIVDLPDLLREGDLLVANASRVVPARLSAQRESGGQVEVLLLEPEGDAIPALLRPARRLKEGEVLSVGSGAGEVEIVSLPDEDGIARVSTRPEAPELMARAGKLPLPPYLRREEEPEDRDRYQTVFATTPGSVAAPTAGLHLTPALLEALAGRGVGFSTVTLHVGLGTFRPLRPEDLARGALHEEPWWVPEETAEAIRSTRRRGGRVIAVGTTACRTLESAVQGGEVRAGHGTTQLFIRPPYAFRAIDGLLTNLHLPRSSLLMLVAALVDRERLMGAYHHAIDSHYRFYSYGDAMLLL